MESDEKIGVWESERLEKLREGDEVPTPNADISQQEMPSWFDAQKFDRAKQVYREHFASINFSHLCGLLLSFYFTKNLKTLRSTGESKNKNSLFHRYLQTVRHTQKWYEGNVFDIDDPAHRSLSLVRAMHAQVAKKMESLKDGIVYVSQWDMAVTQWAFIGPIVLFKSQVGLHYCNDEDFDCLIHFWRSIGFLLGIEDQYNLCDGDYSQVLAACRTLLHKEYKKQVAAASPEAVTMGKNVVSAMSMIDSMLTWNALSTYMHELINVPCPEVMGFMDTVSYYFMCFAWLFMTKYTWLRHFLNDLTRWRLDKADKKDLKLLAAVTNTSGG